MQKKTVVIIASAIAVVGTVATVLAIRSKNKKDVAKMEKEVPATVQADYTAATQGASPSKKKKILKNILALGKNADPQKVKAVLSKLGGLAKKVIKK